MADLTYHVVDVFTDRPFAGNPLAVVLDADDLDTAQCQALAREFNLSETAFAMRSDAATYRVRIFTPGSELPFAGHPSIGTAYLLAHAGRVERGDVTMECAAGVLPVSIGDVVSITTAPPHAGEPLDPAPLLAALGLGPDDIGGAPPRVCSTGIPAAFVEVTPDAVARARQAGDVPDVVTVSVFAWDAATRTAHTRVFAGSVGVGEDPATGSAAASFGAWLAASGYVPEGETAYVVTQGVEMGRPSRIEGTVVVRDGVAVESRIAGTAVPIATGTIRVP